VRFISGIAADLKVFEQQQQQFELVASSSSSSSINLQ
jgi:predicted amidohydrolase